MRSRATRRASAAARSRALTASHRLCRRATSPRASGGVAEATMQRATNAAHPSGVSTRHTPSSVGTVREVHSGSRRARRRRCPRQRLEAAARAPRSRRRGRTCVEPSCLARAAMRKAAYRACAPPGRRLRGWAPAPPRSAPARRRRRHGAPAAARRHPRAHEAHQELNVRVRRLAKAAQPGWLRAPPGSG